MGSVSAYILMFLSRRQHHYGEFQKSCFLKQVTELTIDNRIAFSMLVKKVKMSQDYVARTATDKIVTYLAKFPAVAILLCAYMASVMPLDLNW